MSVPKSESEYKYKYNLSVCVCIKNEAKYMRDFVSHYVGQGVDHFYIVNNGSTDNIEDTIQSLPNASQITMITDNRDMGMLTKDSGAHGHALLLNEHFFPLIVSETKWAIMVDCDEFMGGQNGYTIASYLETLGSEVGCVYVLWNIINPAKDAEGKICEHFVPELNRKRINHDHMGSMNKYIRFASDFGKSIVRTSMCTRLWIHLCHTTGIRINNYGHVLATDKQADNHNKISYSENAFASVPIYLNHYAIRNQDDYIKKHAQLLTVAHKKDFIKGLLEIASLTDDHLIDRVS